jgi:hypothetical protein
MIAVIAILALIALVAVAFALIGSTAATIETAQAAQAAANAASMASAANLVDALTGIVLMLIGCVVIVALIWAFVQVRTAEARRKPPVTINPRPRVVALPSEEPALPQLPAQAAQPTMGLEEIIRLQIMANIANSSNRRD